MEQEIGPNEYLITICFLWDLSLDKIGRIKRSDSISILNVIYYTTYFVK